jgi:hypothetical protein
MKLAEALSIRQDCQTRIEQLKDRIINNVKVQEGEEPSEQPLELMKELNGCLDRLQDLIYRINATNIKVKGKDGRSLTEMLAERDVLAKRIQTMRAVFESATVTQDRYSRTEIKYVKTIDVKALHKDIDRLSAKLRILDIDIQSLNFTEDLE